MYRTVAQLDSVMNILATFFPQMFTRVPLPTPSILGRTVFALRVHAGTATNRRGVFIVGGMHARELMNPDAIADLQLDFARCYLNETSLTIGGRTWSAQEIKAMLESLDIWMLPCANPDGREFVQTVDDMWRKNRRDNPGTTFDGVDINRNCDIVWGVTTINTSCSPSSDTYVGTGPESEPETRNIRWVCDNNQINVFLDVHSFSELVLFPWGHAPVQTTDPSKRFTTLTTGTCAPLTPAGYQEYMLPQDQLRFQRVAQQIVQDINAVRGRNYTPEPVIQLYATTGTSSDYVYSRHIANPALQKTYGFSFETGPNTGNDRQSFHPDDPEPIKRDTKAGIVSLLMQSICAIEFIGSSLLGGTVKTLRSVRDQQLATTPAGQQWIARSERLQTPLLGAVLADKSLTKEAMTLLQRAMTLVEKDKNIVSAADAKRALALLDTLSARISATTVRRDLSAVRKEIEKAGGRTIRAVLDDLLEVKKGSVSKKASATKKSSKSKKPKRRTR